MPSDGIAQDPKAAIAPPHPLVTVEPMASTRITSSQAKRLFIISDERLRTFVKDGTLDEYWDAPVGNRLPARLFDVGQLESVAKRRSPTPDGHHCIEMRLEDLEDTTSRQQTDSAAIHAALASILASIERIEAALVELRPEPAGDVAPADPRQSIWTRIRKWLGL